MEDKYIMKHTKLFEEFVNEAQANVAFFFPRDVIFSNRSRDYSAMTLTPWTWDGSSARANDATNSRVLSVYSSDSKSIDKYIKKYGVPTTNEIKAYKYVNDAFWSLKRKIPSDAYNKFSFYRYGNGSASDMGYVYSPKNGFEFYLNIPRQIRHPEEYSKVEDKDVEMFDKITKGVEMIAKKVKSMGFKTSISSTPDGWTK